MSAAAYDTSEFTIAGANGVWITDIDGNKFLDGCCGTFNVGLGYGNRHVSDALKKVLDLGFVNGSGRFKSETVARAEAALVSIAPPSIDRCHMKGSTGGSTAIEQAMRHAWAVTGRSTLLSFSNSHHGQTIATSLVSGMAFRKERLTNVAIPVEHIYPPDCYRCPFGKQPDSCQFECARNVSAVIDSRSNKIAAVLAEPVLGAGGGIIPRKGYWEIVSSDLAERGVLLISDEVQTFGRLGDFLAGRILEMQPNMIVLSKSISGIGLAGTAALLLPKQYCVLDDGERSLTGGASELSAAAIAATIEQMRRPGFFQRTIEIGNYLRERLDKFEQKFPCVGHVRAAGLMCGLEIVSSKESRAAAPKLGKIILDLCKHAGLLLRSSHYGKGAFIKVRPALTITRDEVDELCSRLEWALSRAYDNTPIY